MQAMGELSLLIISYLCKGENIFITIKRMMTENSIYSFRVLRIFYFICLRREISHLLEYTDFHVVYADIWNFYIMRLTIF